MLRSRIVSGFPNGSAITAARPTGMSTGSTFQVRDGDLDAIDLAKQTTRLGWLAQPPFLRSCRAITTRKIWFVPS